jgi:hypothetical protein
MRPTKRCSIHWSAAGFSNNQARWATIATNLKPTGDLLIRLLLRRKHFLF